jgi:hypothetical protein
MFPKGEVCQLAGFACQVMAGCAGGLLAANNLYDQGRYELQTQRFCVEYVYLPWQTHPVVTDDEHILIPFSMKVNTDLPFGATQKGVLQSIGNELIDDEAAGDSNVKGKKDIFHVYVKGNPIPVHPV